jgi:hypothetical protein
MMRLQETVCKERVRVGTCLSRIGRRPYVLHFKVASIDHRAHKVETAFDRIRPRLVFSHLFIALLLVPLAHGANMLKGLCDWMVDP